MTLTPAIQTYLEHPPYRFADVFLNANPHRCAPLDRAALAAALPARRALFERAGMGPLQLIGGEDQDLGSGFVLAQTRWRAEARDRTLELRSTYVLRRVDDTFEVVFYLNHQDLAELLSAPA